MSCNVISTSENKRAESAVINTARTEEVKSHALLSSEKKPGTLPPVGKNQRNVNSNFHARELKFCKLPNMPIHISSCKGAAFKQTPHVHSCLLK